MRANEPTATESSLTSELSWKCEKHDLLRRFVSPDLHRVALAVERQLVLVPERVDSRDLQQRGPGVLHEAAATRGDRVHPVAEVEVPGVVGIVRWEVRMVASEARGRGSGGGDEVFSGATERSPRDRSEVGSGHGRSGRQDQPQHQGAGDRSRTSNVFHHSDRRWHVDASVSRGRGAQPERYSLPRGAPLPPSCVAAVLTVVFQRLHQPVVLGYIIAGLGHRPTRPGAPRRRPRHRAHTLRSGSSCYVLARPRVQHAPALVELGSTAGLTAIIQCSVLLWLGYVLGRAFGWTLQASPL